MSDQPPRLDIGDKVRVMETDQMKRAGVAGLFGEIPPGGLAIQSAATMKLGQCVRLDVPLHSVELVEKFDPAKTITP